MVLCMDCIFYLFYKVKINIISVKIVYNFLSSLGERGGNVRKEIERSK